MDLEKLGFVRLKRKPTITVNPKLGIIVFNDIVLPSNHCSVFYKQKENQIDLAFNFNENDYEIKDFEIKEKNISKLFSEIVTTSEIEWFNNNILIAKFKIGTEKSKGIKVQRRIVLTESEMELLNEFTEYLLKERELKESTAKNIYRLYARKAIKMINENVTKDEIKELVNREFPNIRSKTMKNTICSVFHQFAVFLTIKFFKVNQTLLEIYIEQKYKKLIDPLDVINYVNESNCTVGELRQFDNSLAKIAVEFYDKVKDGTIYDEINIDTKQFDTFKVIEKTFRD